MTLGEVLAGATGYLAERGVDSPRLDAEHLVSRALELSRIELYTQHDRPLTESERASVRQLVARRGRREPLAYVLGDWDFRHLTLKTDARALIPRPETELVVERCLALLETVAAPRVIDVGTGNGAIALAIAHELPDAIVTATDISADALALARENAQANGLNVTFVESDLLASSTARSSSSSRTRPTCASTSSTRSSPRCATGSRVTPSSTKARPSAWPPKRVPGSTAASCSRCMPTTPARSSSALTSLGYEGARITLDLAGRERVVEAQWHRPPNG